MSEKIMKLKKKLGVKKHGFLNRNRSHSGKKVIKRRRQVGRKRI